MMIPIRIDRTSKPPIGTPLRSDGHWSVQGLVGAWAFNEGAGLSIFDAMGRQYAISGSTWPFLGLKSLAGSSNRVILNNHAQNSFIILWSGTLNVAVASTYRMVSGYSGGSYSFILGPSVEASYTRPRFSVFNTAGATFTAQASVSMPVGKKFTLLGFFDGEFAHLFVDGVLAATSAAFSGTPRSYPIYLGSDGANNNSAAFTTTFLAQYTGSIQDNNLLSTNPWQIYEPETVWVEVGGTETEVPITSASALMMGM